MILEHAILVIRPGEEASFEAAFREAVPLIKATEGFLGLEVRRSIETPSHYALLVKWRSIDDHVSGFRGSDRYPRWKALLHHFYEPFPIVEHYDDPVVTA